MCSLQGANGEGIVGCGCRTVRRVGNPLSRQIPWLRVFVEGVVIVGSILLALAGDTWWGERTT